MPQYTVEAFQWSGTGYNALYNTSYTAVLDDNDPDYQGSGDGDETVSINGAAAVATTGAPYVINVSFTDTLGNPHTEDFYFFNAVGGGGWYFVPAPGSAFTVGATLGSYQSHTTGWQYQTVTCFCAGTRIRTPRGEVPVEALKAGDQVMTDDGRVVRLRLVLVRRLHAVDLMRHEKLRPVCITQGALGSGLPARDLYVSRQHRMLARSAVTRRMFGVDDVLVAAIRLTALPGIYVSPEPQDVAYFHLVFDQHEVVIAEGAPSESFFPGDEALKGLPEPAREEFETLFPQWCARTQPEPACMIPRGKHQKQLVARLAKNNKNVVGLPA